MIHTHRHSEFSLLDGTGSAEQYAKVAADLGQPALALTDHGTLSGALHHYKACHEQGIVPILGVEAYFRPNRLDHTKDNKEYFHLVLIAKNLTGWHNLIRITSEAYQSGFYYKPCVDFELLQLFHEGLILSTACLSSYIAKRIRVGDDSEAVKAFKVFHMLFGDDFFVEIMPHDIPEQRLINIELINLAQEAGVPLLATVDAHYPYREWADTQDVFLMMATGQTIENRQKKKEAGEDTYGFDSDTLYLMSEEEVRDTFSRFHPNLPGPIVDEAIRNTIDLYERCEPLVIDKKQKAPSAGSNAERTLRGWIDGGLRRIEKVDATNYTGRVQYELDTIRRNNAIDYFVIVGDMCRWARSQGIRIGTRGSAAGCLISYLIGITAIDPIPYGLLFERFMNPDRKGLPDIDVDFQSDRRHEVKDYLADKWGRDHVADVVAHQTYAPRACLQGVARVFDVPYKSVTTVTNSIDEGTDLSLSQLRNINQELFAFSSEYPVVWKHATRIEGQIKAVSQHAGGVVITDRPVAEYMPTMRGNKSEMMTAWGDAASFQIISDYGYMKIDVLGVKGLTKQESAVKLIHERTGEIIHLDDLPVMRGPYAAEPEVLQAFADGFTLGVFQFKTRGPTQLMRQVKPTWIGDLAAINALNRPGPLEGGKTREYGEAKHGRVPVYYYDDRAQDVLEETYGIIAYQEQVMEIAKRLAGFTGGQADDLRKAISKEYRNGMAAVKKKLHEQGHDERWKTGTAERGIDSVVADEIWRQIMAFGGYGFNKTIDGNATVERYTTNQHDTDPNITLYEIWDRFYGSKRSTPVGKKYRSKGLWIRGYDAKTDRITKKRVTDIYDHGVLKLYKMTLANGMSVSATLNHRHLTSDGWRTVGDLRAGDEVVIDTKIQDATLASGYRHIFGRGKTTSWIVNSTERSAISGRRILHGHSAALAAVTTELPDYCEWCGNADGRLERAHLDNDRTNNTRDNVVRLCNGCHKMYDGHLRGGPWSRGSLAGVSKIVSIEYDGMRQAYDLEIEGEMEMDHNFSVNGGIITHNSHSVAYALLAYQDMWLKVHYPAEFYAATLTHEKKANEGEDRSFKRALIREAKKFGVNVYGPDVNKSDWGFSVTDNSIYFGLRGVKFMGDKATEEIIEKRPFRNYEDLLERVDKRRVNSKTRRMLEQAGAFDEMGGRQEWTDEEKDEKEVESLGICINQSRKFDQYIGMVKRMVITGDAFDKLDDNDGVTIGGEIIKMRAIITRGGKNMGFCTLGFSADEWDCTIFPDEWEQYKDLVLAGKYVMIRGRKNVRENGKVSVLVDHMCTVEELALALAKE